MTDPVPQLEQLRALAEAGDAASFAAQAQDMHPSDVSDVLAGLDDDVRLALIQQLPPEIVSEALAEMEEEEHPEEVLAALQPEVAADIVDELEDDDAVDLIADLPPEAASAILSEVEDRDEIEHLLAFDEESAGGLMTTRVVRVVETATAAEAIDQIRLQAGEVEDFYRIFCIDRDRKLTGVLALQRLVIAQPDTPVADLMEPVQAVATPEMDQEVVARLMARYNVPAIPVVDPDGRLMGRVTFDDVIDVVEAEQTEDLLKFGGVGSDEGLGGEWYDAVRLRLPWLYLNLMTAFLAAAVVVLFESTISRIVTLAAVMPVVAGLGGSAGTQALAVTIRRIALGMTPAGTGLRLVGKELVVGLVNGLAIGVVLGATAVLLGHGWQLGVVVAVAMWGALVVAATVGAAVPLILQRVGADPAVASSGFVTAVTDIAGFFLLLGLAAWLLL
jgi:magnesium transporter